MPSTVDPFSPSTLDETGDKMVRNYGPYAFGISSVIALAMTGVMIWHFVAAPSLTTALDVAKENTKAIEGLREVSYSLNVTSSNLNTSINLLNERSKMLDKWAERLDHKP